MVSTDITPLFYSKLNNLTDNKRINTLCRSSLIITTHVN